MALLPVPNAFFWLITIQLIHALEEYAFELWVVFAPTRFFSTLVSENPELGYIMINAGIVAFGYWCYFVVIARGRSWSIFFIPFWLFFAIGNGLGHLTYSALLGHYIPGLYTAPFLLIAAFVLWRSWRAEKPKKIKRSGVHKVYR
jgi:hypothetical protein